MLYMKHVELRAGPGPRLAERFRKRGGLGLKKPAPGEVLGDLKHVCRV